MAGDAAYEQSIVAVLEDEGVDAAVVGVVPLSPALSTLAAASAHKEDLKSPGAVASRLKKAWEAHTKPWVVVVDAGAQYDQFVAAIEEAGIPVFRAADRALKIFNIFCFGKTAIQQHRAEQRFHRIRQDGRTAETAALAFAFAQL